MEKVISLNENALDVTFNLKTYLEAEFDFVYNHNNFFIVANNDAPINSLANTTAEDIWLKIIDYVKELMPDVKLMFDYEGPDGNVVEEVPIPIGATFFWPESGV